MLTYLKLKNFKSFNEITLDLRGKHGIPKKIAFIYGENGSGKSNLMLSMLFINKTLTTFSNQEQIKKLKDTNINEMLLDIKNEVAKEEILQFILREQLYSLSDLIKDFRSLNGNGSMVIEIGFYIDNENGSYRVEFNNDVVISEELKFQINQRKGTFYSINDGKITLSPSVFTDNEYKNELLNDIEKFWGRHTFMSILFNEKATKNTKYIKNRITKNMFSVMNWLDEFSVLSKNSQGETAHVTIPYGFLRQLDKGTIKNTEDKEIYVFEKILNTLFTQLYSDVKSVYYKIITKEDETNYELYFRKLINGNITDIPFSLESTGTRKLLNVFPFIFSALAGTTVFVDEIDSGIHDILMCRIIEFIGESIKGQIIVTTHNTLLMKQLNSEDVFIIISDANANKKITSINKFEFRTHKNHNTQTKYLNGDYAGVPYIGYIDFEDMINEVNDALSSNKKSL